MAKQIGPFFIQGTINGLSFYKSGDQFLVRRPGGPSRKQVLKSPQFIRTRENASEFGRTQLDLNAFWLQCRLLLQKNQDNKANKRLLALFIQIMKLDTESSRGERTVRKGVFNPESDPLLVGFDFNRFSPLSTVLKIPVLLNSINQVSIKDLVPMAHLSYPTSAAYVCFSAARVNLIRPAWEFECQLSEKVLMPLDTVTRNIVLSFPDRSPDFTKSYYLLKIEFLAFVGEVANKGEESNRSAVTIIGKA